MSRGIIPLVALAAAAITAPLCAAEAAYTPPVSPRATINFNPDWKFLRSDAPGAERADFDDAAWQTVSLPHTWNDVDTYRAPISHSRGDRSGAYRGIGWYRKHFRLPESASGGKVFVEFEGLRQAAWFWINGHPLGRFENGVTACGLDLTGQVAFGERDNVLAVRVDNRPGYREQASGVPFEWNSPDFNPDFGGLNRDAWLHLTGPVYQTLPLYENLGTTGVYVHADSIDPGSKAVELTIESQVRNESGDFASVSLSAVVVDDLGIARAQFDGDTTDLVNGQTETLAAQGRLDGARLWDPSDPRLYAVYTILSVDGKPVDVSRVLTGFRATEFRGGAGRGGVWINGRFVWLTGYAQRSADDWPGLGAAYPDWMHEYNAALIRSTHANYLRWMHVAPQRADVAACDREGIVEVCPAGDKERDAQGRQWEQRMEVMRDTMIYYRNCPSILFWEAGNTVISPQHMRSMIELKRRWDPLGGRAIGTRGNDNNEANAAITGLPEYYGVMIGQAPQVDALGSPGALFRAYSAARRDQAPILETEDFRDEAPRGIWDDFSPPHFGFKPGPEDAYHWNSEEFCLAGAARYASYVANRIDNRDPAHARWSGYASIYWSDSDADGRQQSSEVLRVSGKVDGVRLPKEMYYVSRVMQSPGPDLHILGHWTYPAGTRKTVYVAASHCDAVELVLNGRSLGVKRTPCVFVDAKDPDPRTRDHGSTGCIYAFGDVAFEPGTLSAVATRGGAVVAREDLRTAGPVAGLRLTVRTGPEGLLADGADVALVDVEAVDAEGRRRPTDEARVDFELRGPGVWRGGLDSGLPNSTNNLHLDTECGINRVAIRSTLQPGTIVLTARRAGLPPATARILSSASGIDRGLAEAWPQGSAGPIEAGSP